MASPLRFREIVALLTLLVTLTARGSSAQESATPSATLTLVLGVLRQLAETPQAAPALAPAPAGWSWEHRAPAPAPSSAPLPVPAPSSAPQSAPAPSRAPQPAPAPSSAPLPAPSSLPQPAPAPAPVPQAVRVHADSALPGWAFMPASEGCGGQSRQQREAAASVAEAAAAGTRLDLALFGDSMTVSFHQEGSFKRHFGDLQALALGMCGSSVGHLAARILAGGERPVPPPRVALLLIGANNILPEKGLPPPAAHLDWLVGWMRSAWPDTQVVVLGLLPTSWRDVGPEVVPQTNEQYAELAARHRAAYVDCGAGLDPSDPFLFKDGLHPASRGQDVFLSCVRLQLQRYLAA